VKKIFISLPLIILAGICSIVSCKKDQVTNPGILQLAHIDIGTVVLNLQAQTTDVPVDSIIVIGFNNQLDTGSVRKGVLLQKVDHTDIGFVLTFTTDRKSAVLTLNGKLDYQTAYQIQISSAVKGLNGETFPGIEVSFSTVAGKLEIDNITLNGLEFRVPLPLQNINPLDITINIKFSYPLDSLNYQSFFILSGQTPLTFSISDDNKNISIKNAGVLNDYSRFFFTISKNLTAKNGFSFDGFSNSFYTALDSTYKFPSVTDEQLLDLVQQQTFRYFYDFSHPLCGLARERNTSGDIVTIGGSGFGVMALIVGMNRGFITRADGLAHLTKILGFLETCDRFHGAWPHWLNGSTGETIPFSPNDDGGDLVETSFMIEGLLTMRQYLDTTVIEERELAGRINTLAGGVEYDWFTRGQNVLYWHWSPNSGWAMNLKIEGYNETLIIYVLAASSTTHPVSADVYHLGYAKNGAIMNGNTYYGYTLPLGSAYGGPLFFTHYSFLGLDPRNLSDIYASYWEQNVNQSLINWAYCTDNPKNYVGYSAVSWGLTASDNPWGYDAQSPTNDLGVITPTAAVSALPYTPEQSMNAIRHFYYILGDHLWGPYGFYDAFDVTDGWWADSYIAIDEGPIICMIENYRSGLLWNLFMSSPEIDQALAKLGFTH
jgi:hypothetical protein